MYNQKEIERLVKIVEENNGIGDKAKLAEKIQKEFALEKERKVYYNRDFAIRFSKSENKRMSNTVLALSALQKYDEKPFLVCIVASKTNYLLLANATFLKKISHSSQALRVDNIKGSFNGSDIMLDFEELGLENEPKNFQELFSFHQEITFQDNLERLVESTNGIVGRVKKFEITPEKKECILQAITRTKEFMQSKEYKDLEKDFIVRVGKVFKEIQKASQIDNVNLRGRVMEYLITENDSELKKKTMQALDEKGILPPFKTEDKLGDYAKIYPNYHVEVDIKTKMLFLDGNPKGYNVDKLLEFLATEKSIYMLFLLGIGKDGTATLRLCSIFDKRLISNTRIIQHWAGRNSRGVAQFLGNGLTQILEGSKEPQIDEELATEFLTKLINL